jgi:hypothetical protein
VDLLHCNFDQAVKKVINFKKSKEISERKIFLKNFTRILQLGGDGVPCYAQGCLNRWVVC